jgi:LacI family transcriptional regulator
MNVKKVTSGNFTGSAEVTIKDIARKAKVSHATVSRALNNKSGVREATRRRILQLASEMSYTPNAIARGFD